MICAYGLSKGRNSGMTKCIHLKLLREDKPNDQLTKKVIFARYFYYYTTTTTNTITTAITETTASAASTTKVEAVELNI